MVRVTCLSPTISYSYCSLALAHTKCLDALQLLLIQSVLIVQASNNDPYDVGYYAPAA